MKAFLCCFFILVAFTLKCQDKLFFLDGTTKSGKITQITPEQITVKIDYENIEFPRSSVLLLEFADGSCEVINTPSQNITNVADKKENFHFKQSKKEAFNYNRVSVNSLALCNADIAAFYERLLPTKKVGLGVMGAYNFNINANGSNSYIAFLANAKKKYDLGGFINFYPTRFEKRTFAYLGIMIKYTSFNYTRVIEDSAKVGNLVSVTTSFAPAKASQLATIFTIGSHSDITKNFFIKTIFGLGAFKLHGDYRNAYNIEINKLNNKNNSGQTKPPLDVHYLPKLYFGINLGFKL